MPLGTPYLTDTIPHAVGNGQLQQLTAAQLSTQYGAGNIKTASASFVIPHAGQLIHFYKNVPVIVTAALSTALTNAGAPVV